MEQLATPLGSPDVADGTLHLPVPALFADLDAGSGAVQLTEAFKAASASVRQRVLQDWLMELRVESDRALVDLFHEFVRPLSRLSIVEQVDMFKRSCRRQDIGCPTDFAVLLQRI